MKSNAMDTLHKAMKSKCCVTKNVHRIHHKLIFHKDLYELYLTATFSMALLFRHFHKKKLFS